MTLTATRTRTPTVTATFTRTPSVKPTALVVAGRVDGVLLKTPWVPGTHSLAAAPNPAGDRVLIRFVTAAAGDVALDLYDVSGQRVKAWDLGTREAGFGEAPLDLRGVPAGIYLLCLHSPGPQDQPLQDVFKLAIQR